MKNYKRLKAACYTVNISMSAISNVPPLLFLTFRELYGISYSLLGLLVLVNFSTQLTIDLIFSFFSHKFNIPKTVKFTPIITLCGMLIFALAPFLPDGLVFLGLAIGTVIFSVSGGLVEVLISPVIAAIPSDNPDREMSKLHSLYAWGVVGTVLFSTAYIFLFGGKSWQILMVLLALIPLCSAILFFGAKIPEVKKPEQASGAIKAMKNPTLWFCFFCIFLGGASECTMAQWCSGYLEKAVGIDKIFGDIFGVAIFGLTLGLGRTLYAKIGKNIEKVLFFGAIGATACYLIATLSPIPIIGLVACALTGFCVSMLWPGCLIVMENKLPGSGVVSYAMMAAGGDLGASVGPQLVGVITDGVIAYGGADSLASSLGMSVEALGMKAGMLIGSLFPLAAIILYTRLIKRKKTGKTSSEV